MPIDIGDEKDDDDDDDVFVDVDVSTGAGVSDVILVEHDEGCIIFTLGFAIVGKSQHFPDIQVPQHLPDGQPHTFHIVHYENGHGFNINHTPASSENNFSCFLIREKSSSALLRSALPESCSS